MNLNSPAFSVIRRQFIIPTCPYYPCWTVYDDDDDDGGSGGNGSGDDDGDDDDNNPFCPFSR